jgi:hypothetical protein
VQKESFVGPQDERIAILCSIFNTEGIIRLKIKAVERADLGDFVVTQGDVGLGT